MRIYWENTPAKIHPDQSWNVRALGFLKRSSQQEQEQEEEEQQQQEQDE